jgi:hypothetical protein
MGEYPVIRRMPMKRLIGLAIVALAFALVAGSTVTYAQGTFRIPFKFQAGGKKFPAGEYRVAQKADASITLRKEPNGEEAPVAFVQRLAQPKPPFAEPQLVFDVVGNFEPSYTEYVTDYVLAEVWFPGGDGFLVHTTKGAHQSKTIKGEMAK